MQDPRHRAIAERDEDLVAVDCESMLDGDVQGSIDAAAVRDVVQVLRGPVGVQGRMETDDVRLSERANGVSVEIDCAGQFRDRLADMSAADDEQGDPRQDRQVRDAVLNPGFCWLPPVPTANPFALSRSTHACGEASDRTPFRNSAPEDTYRIPTHPPMPETSLIVRPEKFGASSHVTDWPSNVNVGRSGDGGLIAVPSSMPASLSATTPMPPSISLS